MCIRDRLAAAYFASSQPPPSYQLPGNIDASKPGEPNEYQMAAVSYTHLDVYKRQGKTQAGPDGRIAKAARLAADFLESPPESPSAADLTLLREMALMTAPYADAGIDARKRRRRASGPKSSK